MMLRLCWKGVLCVCVPAKVVEWLSVVLCRGCIVNWDLNLWVLDLSPVLRCCSLFLHLEFLICLEESSIWLLHPLAGTGLCVMSVHTFPVDARKQPCSLHQLFLSLAYNGLPAYSPTTWPFPTNRSCSLAYHDCQVNHLNVAGEGREQNCSFC